MLLYLKYEWYLLLISVPFKHSQVMAYQQQYDTSTFQNLLMNRIMYEEKKSPKNLCMLFAHV